MNLRHYTPGWKRTNETPCPPGAFDCPHCGTRSTVDQNLEEKFINHNYGASFEDKEDGTEPPVVSQRYKGAFDILKLFCFHCPSCHHPTFFIEFSRNDRKYQTKRELKSVFLYPEFNPDVPKSELIPPDYTQIFEEMISIMEKSPRSSFALGKLLLERFLKENNYPADKPGRVSLAERMEAFLKDTGVPRKVREFVDIVRKQSKIFLMADERPPGFIGVEGRKEAEACMFILGTLFEYYFVELPRYDKRLKDSLDRLNTMKGAKPVQKENGFGNNIR